MENENQKLSFAETLKVIDEICDSAQDCVTNCPFMKQDFCIVKDIGSIKRYADEIEVVCAEWKNAPSLADKINEILKPYGMKLGIGMRREIGNYICFNDDIIHTNEEITDNLTTTKWKGEPNE